MCEYIQGDILFRAFFRVAFGHGNGLFPLFEVHGCSDRGQALRKSEGRNGSCRSEDELVDSGEEPASRL